VLFREGFDNAIEVVFQFALSKAGVRIAFVDEGNLEKLLSGFVRGNNRSLDVA
jgi:hypothetical protein